MTVSEKSVAGGAGFAALLVVVWVWLAGRGDPDLAGAAALLLTTGLLVLAFPGRPAGYFSVASVGLAQVLTLLAIGRLPGDAFETVPLPALVIVALAISTEIWLLPRVRACRLLVRAEVLVLAAMLLGVLAPPVI